MLWNCHEHKLSILSVLFFLCSGFIKQWMWNLTMIESFVLSLFYIYKRTGNKTRYTSIYLVGSKVSQVTDAVLWSSFNYLHVNFAHMYISKYCSVLWRCWQKCAYFAEWDWNLFELVHERITVLLYKILRHSSCKY